jgi:arylsulfatase A-like enzyme
MRNIVIVCLDSVRKDYFDEYAEQLGERADITVEQCRAVSSWSVPSHASMLTGQLPSEHGVHTHNIDFRDIAPRSVTSQLENHRSVCVTANGFTTEEFGFETLFDELVTVSPGQRFPKGNDAGGKSTKTILDEALDSEHPLLSMANGAFSKFYWLINTLPLPSPFDQGANLVSKHSVELFEDTESPVFLFTNFMEGHLPHQPRLQFDSEIHSVPWSWTSTAFDYAEANRQGQEYINEHETDIEYFRQLYSANIDYLDRKIVQFIEDIESKASRETTFIITADHGENLAFADEDYLMGHSSSLSEALLHVPLTIINPPDDWEAELDVTSFLSHLELPRLVESLAAGESFVPREDVVVAELIGEGAKAIGDDEFWKRMIRCAYLGDYKYVWDSLGTASLFKIDTSRPGEQSLIETGVDLPDEATARFQQNITEYNSTLDSEYKMGVTDDVDASTQERLKDLGYM